MLHIRLAIGLGLAVVAPAAGRAAPLPPDVRAGHWAAGAVTRSLDSGLLQPQSDGRFHGDARVTRLEAVVALQKLARAVVDGTWKSGGRSHPVPDTVANVWRKTDWKAEPVRRYAFAVVLARFGDYMANALARPATSARLGKSAVLPTPMLSMPPGSPGYEALSYLAKNRMIRAGSPLLKPGSAPITGADLGRVLGELGAGVVDKLTDIGPSDDGSAPDNSSPKTKPH